MDVIITIRHTEVGSEVREFARKKLKQLEHHWPRLLDGHLIIDRERSNYLVEVNINAGHHRFSCHDREHEIHSAIDGAVAKVEKKIRKMKTEYEKQRKRKTVLGEISPP